MLVCVCVCVCVFVCVCVCLCFGAAEVGEVSHIYLSSPSPVRALGVRVAEGKNAQACLCFLRVCFCV